MLTTTADQRGVTPATAELAGGQHTGRAVSAAPTSGPADRSRLARVLRVEWLGQTAASVCWIASVLTYGIISSGDWLQLAAASAWLVANIAAAVATEAH